MTDIIGKVIYNSDKYETITEINKLLDKAKIPVNVLVGKNNKNSNLELIYLNETKIEGE